METKQDNSQTLSKPQSSKTQVVKTPSEVSLTPSQAAEQSKINARKNPLDALSRLSLRNQGVEKRSGLQDVDDEYFKTNLYSRSNLNKHSGLGENYDHYGQINSKAQGDASHTQMQQHQSKQQSPHLTQIHPTSLSHKQIHQVAENVQQQQSSYKSQNPSLQMQGKNQSYKESHLVSDSHKQHQQQQHIQPPVAETELCTTCPNCQTTIYLLRGHETSGELAQGSNLIHHDASGNTTSN